MDLTNQMHIATKGSKIDISEEIQTAKIAKIFSSFLKKGNVVFFYGEIGVGKTTFIRYLINNIQKKNKVKLSEVPSPTFNLLNEYEINNIVVHHYDLFRLKNDKEIKNIGLFQEIKNVITLIEWPELIKNKPSDTLELHFKYEKNLKKRSLLISTKSKKILNEFK